MIHEQADHQTSEQQTRLENFSSSFLFVNKSLTHKEHEIFSDEMEFNTNINLTT